MMHLQKLKLVLKKWVECAFKMLVPLRKKFQSNLRTNIRGSYYAAFYLGKRLGSCLNYQNEELGKWENVVKWPPLVHASDSDDHHLFMQFSFLEIKTDESLQKIYGWANPDLLFLARSIHSNRFFDCTFKIIVPKGFSQLLIIMVYHPNSKLYLPIFFILLLQSKKYETY